MPTMNLPFPPHLHLMRWLTLSMAILFLSAPGHLPAKAAFLSESDLITKSAVIAIIELGEPVDVEQKSATWTYRKQAPAKVITRLKGDLPDTFTLHGHETFICAQCQLSAGRHLAFLTRNGPLWVGTNWHLSLRPIRKGEIEWFTPSPKDGLTLKYQPEATVLQRIQTTLQSASSSPADTSHRTSSARATGAISTPASGDVPSTHSNLTPMLPVASFPNTPEARRTTGERAKALLLAAGIQDTPMTGTAALTLSVLDTHAPKARKILARAVLNENLQLSIIILKDNRFQPATPEELAALAK